MATFPIPIEQFEGCAARAESLCPTCQQSSIEAAFYLVAGTRDFCPDPFHTMNRRAEIVEFARV